ncbi:MAG: glycoside hydrolase [Chloroflexi bacterium]|nr:glycoside hydrolase [Chloroflexota bacterium]
MTAQQNESNHAALRADAQRVLRWNDRRDFTTPSPYQYPHQWNWDAACIALGWSYFDVARARTEIRALLRAQWRSGMAPHIIYHHGASDYFPPPEFWQTQGLAHGGTVLASGLTQPPVLATIVRRMHERLAQEPEQENFLREIFPKILAWHRWLHTARDADGTGLPCLIHPWESGTDNSPRWLAVLDQLTPYDVPAYTRRDMTHVHPDERPRAEDYERFVFLIDRGRRVQWDDARIMHAHPFLVQDVLFCSILHQANQDLLFLGNAIGADTGEIQAWIEKTRAFFNARFWDAERGLYLDYDVRAGAAIPVNTCATFAPLYAGLAASTQVTRLMREHYDNPNEYAPDEKSGYRVPSTAKNEPDYAPRRYWCGPVWMMTNWLMVRGLKRYRLHSHAAELLASSLALMETRGLREYYDPRDGTGLGGKEFAWTAGLALDFIAMDAE